MLHQFVPLFGKIKTVIASRTILPQREDLGSLHYSNIPLPQSHTQTYTHTLLPHTHRYLHLPHNAVMTHYLHVVLALTDRLAEQLRSAAEQGIRSSRGVHHHSSTVQAQACCLQRGCLRESMCKYVVQNGACVQVCVQVCASMCASMLFRTVPACKYVVQNGACVQVCVQVCASMCKYVCEYVVQNGACVQVCCSERCLCASICASMCKYVCKYVVQNGGQTRYC